MHAEQFNLLEKKVEALLGGLEALKQENERLKEQNRNLLEERAYIRVRVDAVLKKLEGI